MSGTSHVEHERKWLARRLPGLGPGTPIRQGYLAREGTVTVRVRQRGDVHLVTIKGGDGASRTEVEWVVTAADFAALWPLTEGRRIAKVRHEVPVDGGIAEVDRFEGALAGLVLVEVEFASVEAMAAFVAPDWFGPEVTEHGGYGNGTLARYGIPGDHPSGFPAT